MLEVTVGSVNSALKRARASLQRRQQPAAGRPPPPAAGSPAEDAIVTRFARAWQSADLDALVARVRPRANPSQRSARVRRLPARPGRNPPRDRLLCAHPGRRPDLRYHPLRGQRAAVVRATTLTPEPIASTGPDCQFRLRCQRILCVREFLGSVTSRLSVILPGWASICLRTHAAKMGVPRPTSGWGQGSCAAPITTIWSCAVAGRRVLAVLLPAGTGPG